MIFGCNSRNFFVTISKFANLWLTEVVKREEETMLLSMGIKWLIISIFLIIRSFRVLCSVLLIQSTMIFLLFLIGRAKLSPNYKRHWIRNGNRWKINKPTFSDGRQRIREIKIRKRIRWYSLRNIRNNCCLTIQNKWMPWESFERYV